MKDAIRTDALVTAADVCDIKAEINRGNFKRLVHELVAQEPELAIAISEKFALVTSLLEGCSMSIRQRAALTRQLSLLVWTPVLLLARTHRRSWNDFLPSEATVDPADEGGVE